MSSPAPAEPVPRPYAQTLLDLLFAPAEAFRDLQARPRAWQALLLVVLVSLAVSAVWLSRVDLAEFMRAQIELQGRPQPPAEKLEGVLHFVRIVTWLGPFIVALSLLLLALVFQFAFNFLLEAELGFTRALSVTAHAFLVTGSLAGVLGLVVLALKGEWQQPPVEALQANLGALLDRGTTAKPLFALAGSLDLFSLWTAALLSVGFGLMTRRGTGSAAWTVGVLWGLVVLVKVGWAALF